MTGAGDAAADPAAMAARISASLKAGLEQQPHVVACSPDLVRVLTAFLDAAAPMIAAALERDRLAASLAAAEAERDALALSVGERDRRIAKLEEALGPFARAADEVRPDVDDMAPMHWFTRPRFFRAAARALSEPRP